MHTCTYVCSIHRDLKRALDPLELELQMVMSLCMGVGNPAQDHLEEQPVLLIAEASLQPFLSLL